MLFKNNSTNPISYLVLLTAMYIAGLIGLNIPQTTHLFQWLTPFNLLVSLGILLYFHQQWNRSFIIFCVITFLTGFFIELAGVKTGVIFGEYQYETTLGFKILEVPPVIGVNWLLLVYCVGSSFCQTSKPIYIKVLYGALLMTMLDFLVEPVAIRLNMWSWKEANPPIENYIAWFIVSAVLLTLFHSMRFRKDNPIARWLLILQICFFGIQNFIY
ncbi:carotenoid biosynthesis protein [Emticicia sp. C21]|uniref:carotenoid biosynthesis protein n=1 Tax=Emticicia sp. C21 TaxID=2302915 RepID=UPI000E347AD2|nr:carotenoid biosynthesis protein [Emticicia sp. C21]RFS15300.1 carotenoid biosynthesis protein [Emticicia sp. C21]